MVFHFSHQCSQYAQAFNEGDLPPEFLGKWGRCCFNNVNLFLKPFLYLESAYGAERKRFTAPPGPGFQDKHIAFVSQEAKCKTWPGQQHPIDGGRLRTAQGSEQRQHVSPPQKLLAPLNYSAVKSRFISEAKSLPEPEESFFASQNPPSKHHETNHQCVTAKTFGPWSPFPVVAHNCQS